MVSKVLPVWEHELTEYEERKRHSYGYVIQSLLNSARNCNCTIWNNFQHKVSLYGIYFCRLSAKVNSVIFGSLSLSYCAITCLFAAVKNTKLYSSQVALTHIQLFNIQGSNRAHVRTRKGEQVFSIYFDTDGKQEERMYR